MARDSAFSWRWFTSRGRIVSRIAVSSASTADSRSKSICNRIQNSGDMLKSRANRSAVSAVIPRRSRTISEMRVTGTRSSIASALDDRPSGFMKSSRNISPGCSGGIRAPSSNSAPSSAGSVVVDNLDLIGIPIPPPKADSPSIVDAQAPQPLPIAFQLFQPIARRLKEFFYPRNAVDLPQLAQRQPLKRRIPPAMVAVEHLFGLFVGKRAYHA